MRTHQSSLKEYYFKVAFYYNSFHKKPAISAFDCYFGSILNLSKTFATVTGSVQTILLKYYDLIKDGSRSFGSITINSFDSFLPIKLTYCNNLQTPYAKGTSLTYSFSLWRWNCAVFFSFSIHFLGSFSNFPSQYFSLLTMLYTFSFDFCLYWSIRVFLLYPLFCY